VCVCVCMILILQVLNLLHDSNVRGTVYRAAVAVLEGMHARQSGLTNRLVTEPLLEPLLKCLDFTGKVILFYFICHIEIDLQSHVDSWNLMTRSLEVSARNRCLKTRDSC